MSSFDERAAAPATAELASDGTLRSGLGQISADTNEIRAWVLTQYKSGGTMYSDAVFVILVMGPRSPANPDAWWTYNGAAYYQNEACFFTSPDTVNRLALADVTELHLRTLVKPATVAPGSDWDTLVQQNIDDYGIEPSAWMPAAGDPGEEAWKEPSGVRQTYHFKKSTNDPEIFLQFLKGSSSAAPQVRIGVGSTGSFPLVPNQFNDPVSVFTQFGVPSGARQRLFKVAPPGSPPPNS